MARGAGSGPRYISLGGVTISAFDLFKIGVGPSSSHTVGPMRAACLFARRLDREGKLAATTAVRVELFGSLGATGHGHGTVGAVVAGLSGQMPDTVDPQCSAGPDLPAYRPIAAGDLMLAERGSTDLTPGAVEESSDRTS